jgi:hypothetical protein
MKTSRTASANPLQVRPKRIFCEADIEMNDYLDSSGRLTVIAIGNSACSRSPRSSLNRVLRRNRLALSNGLAWAPELALADPGKVCRHGGTGARSAMQACADATAPIGTYHANRPALQRSVGSTHPQVKAVDSLTGQGYDKSRYFGPNRFSHRP